MSREARLEKTGQGLTPATAGWYVLNLADACWYESEQFGKLCALEGKYQFPHTGLNLRVLGPGQPACYYHQESQQEDFLVLSGQCRLLVDEEVRELKAWDFVHCPPGVPHVFVGAGERPCVIFMIGARAADATIRYPVSDLALKHEAGVERETGSGREAYASCKRREPIANPWPIR
jgi:uncharacterized cupin superfamily protein